MTKIQRVEINKFCDHPIYCPFCGKKAVEYNDGGTANPCAHTLFVGTDEGFEYRSSRFDHSLGIQDIAEEDLDLPDRGIDGLTDGIDIEDAVKFASYIGPPSGFGCYVAFAPLDEPE